jgi:hypothetical protein
MVLGEGDAGSGDLVVSAVSPRWSRKSGVDTVFLPLRCPSDVAEATPMIRFGDAPAAATFLEPARPPGPLIEPGN